MHIHRSAGRTGRRQLGIILISLPLWLLACEQSSNTIDPPDATFASTTRGQHIFRYETFGDEDFWTNTLRMHEVIMAGVDPTTALTVGLKVDADALPPGILDNADLTDPATTVALIKLNAVVGIQGTVDKNNNLVSVGITCALCHSTVDNSVMQGIGRRLDGWPNRDLDVGSIIALSPAIEEPAKSTYDDWDPGFYDPRFSIDGEDTPLVIPPAYGLAGIDNETYTGDGPISYWNAYVAVTQMHGKGTFIDERLGISVVNKPDLVTPKLKHLLAYQLSLPAPPPPPNSFDEAAAEDGADVFADHCQSCHVNVTGTDNNDGVLHDPEETGMDGAYAARTVNKKYRTTPLRALWQHAPYFHNGSAASLEAVVAHYNDVLELNLSTEEQEDLVEFLKSL